MNFGETLVYWYLRFNGFFPLANLVLHQPAHEPVPAADAQGAPARRQRRARQNADADLLAVRLPHVYEDVGGRIGDWHGQFLAWGIDLSQDVVCVIAEVKTGRYKKSDVNEAFRPQRLKYTMARFGAVPIERVEGYVEEFARVPFLRLNDVVFAKLLVDVADHRPGDRAENQLEMVPLLRLTLDDVADFIEDRLRRYSQKAATRMLFPGNLIQFLAWRSGIEVGDPEDEDEEREAEP